MPHGAQDLGGSPIGQVPVVAAHAALQEQRVTRGCQQLRVVVCFQQQRMAAGQVLQHMRTGVPQVGQQGQVRRAVAAAQLQGFAGVVRHREGQGFKSAQVDRLAVVRQPQQAVEIGGAEGAVGAMAHPHRKALAQRQAAHAADVVGMLVRDEHGIDLLQRQPGLAQPRLQLADAQAAVHQQTAHLRAGAALYHGGIAGAATAQVAKAQHGVCAPPLPCGQPTSGRRPARARCFVRWPKFPVHRWRFARPRCWCCLRCALQCGTARAPRPPWSRRSC